jgi:hypothetical protein
MGIAINFILAIIATCIMCAVQDKKFDAEHPGQSLKQH